MTEALGFFGALIVVSALLFAGINALAGNSCRQQWEHSGFQSEYSFMTGCMISKDGKVWIPADAYREISE
jgi:hypothetical protein